MMIVVPTIICNGHPAVVFTAANAFLSYITICSTSIQSTPNLSHEIPNSGRSKHLTTKGKCGRLRLHFGLGLARCFFVHNLTGTDIHVKNSLILFALADAEPARCLDVGILRDTIRLGRRLRFKIDLVKLCYTVGIKVDDGLGRIKLVWRNIKSQIDCGVGRGAGGRLLLLVGWRFSSEKDGVGVRDSNCFGKLGLER